MMKLCRDAKRLTAFSLISITACLVMSACAGLGASSTQPILPDGRLFTQVGFIDTSAQDALIRSYLKSPSSTNQDKLDLTIYIEGDGAAWTMRQFAPSNPTPRHALGAQLASEDPSSLVAYLGRPCQYLDSEQLQRCDPSLWTDGRFSPAAISLGNKAIDVLLQRLAPYSAHQQLQIRLVGYSGGGAYAALLANKRTDVICLITIAAPLDIEAWSGIQRIAPLRTSLNPASPSQILQKIDQTHWYGQKDRIVPPQSIGLFLATNTSSNTQVHVLPKADHLEPWTSQWPELLQKSCGK
jgi:pimeloyl-ACP methyl ester carboxylesterase